MSAETRLQLSEALSSLRSEPTSDAWELVLRSAISGSMDKELQRYGRIEDFVGTTIANSKVPINCRIVFNKAFEEIVAKWNPATPDKWSAINHMLRLIAAFRPQAGFHIIAGHLDSSSFFNYTDYPTEQQEKDVFLLALMSLQYYFPTSPSQPLAYSAYNTYLRVLWRIVERGPVRGHACRRLLELGIANAADYVVADLIDAHFLEVAEDLITWLLASDWSSRSILLSRLYGRGLRDEESQTFVDTLLDAYGAKIHDAKDGPAVVLGTGVNIDLYLTAEEFDRYVMTVRWPCTKSLNIGRQVLASLTKER